MHVLRFINIYMYVDNAKKSYIMKRREYDLSFCIYTNFSNKMNGQMLQEKVKATTNLGRR
jgi:hypothetical protein